MGYRNYDKILRKGYIKIQDLWKIGYRIQDIGYKIKDSE